MPGNSSNKIHNKSDHKLRQILSRLGQQKAFMIKKCQDISHIEKIIEKYRTELDNRSSNKRLYITESGNSKNSKYTNYSNTNVEHPFVGGTVSPK